MLKSNLEYRITGLPWVGNFHGIPIPIHGNGIGMEIRFLIMGIPIWNLQCIADIQILKANHIEKRMETHMRIPKKSCGNEMGMEIPLPPQPCNYYSYIYSPLNKLAILLIFVLFAFVFREIVYHIYLLVKYQGP